MSETKESIIAEENTVAEVPKETKASSEEKITAEETSEADATPSPEAKAERKSKTPLIIALCVLVAIVVGALAFTFGSGGNGVFDPLFYMSYDGVYMKDLGTGKKEAVKILDADGEEAYLTGVLINAELTEALIGLDSGNGADLYSFDLTDISSKPVKIAEAVNSFAKDEGTGIITCNIGESSTLVQLDSDLKQTEIAENVDYFELSEDGLSLYYTDMEGGTYLVQNGKDVVELTKDGVIEYYDANLTLFYVLEEGSLYKVTATGERTLIDKDVALSTFTDEDGYYHKTVKTIYIKDLFEDDMAQADNEIKIPEDTDSEAYKLYTQRLTRDQIRAFIIDPETVYMIQDVYYFDGTQSKKVLENVFGDELTYYNPFFGEEASTSANLFCSVIDTDKIKKVKMSEIWEIVSNEETSLIGGIEDVTDLISEPLIEGCTDYFVYKGDFAADIGINGVIFGHTLDEKNNVLYVTASDSVYGDCTLYRLPITDGAFGEAEVICEGVNSYETTISEDGKLYYIKEVYDEEVYESVCTVYLDSEIIAENVSNVIENNLEKGLFVMDKYHLNEDGTPDFESYPYHTVLYNAETDSEFTLNAEGTEYYYSLYYTPAGNTIILECDYGYEDVATTLYSIDGSKLKPIINLNGEPDYFDFMSERRDGSGYFDWGEDDFEIWSDGELLDGDMTLGDLLG